MGDKEKRGGVSGGFIKLKKQVDTERLTRLMQRVKETKIEVGFPLNSGNYPDGTPVCEVAIKNEFGIGIPERSFFRTSNDNNRSKYGRIARELAKKVVDGTMRIEAAAGLLGVEAVGDIQDMILAVDYPPNSPATLARKYPKTHPLIDTGLMRQSVTWRVIK